MDPITLVLLAGLFYVAYKGGLLSGLTGGSGGTGNSASGSGSCTKTAADIASSVGVPASQVQAAMTRTGKTACDVTLADIQAAAGSGGGEGGRSCQMNSQQFVGRSGNNFVVYWGGKLVLTTPSQSEAEQKFNQLCGG